MTFWVLSSDGRGKFGGSGKAKKEISSKALVLCLFLSM